MSDVDMRPMFVLGGGEMGHHGPSNLEAAGQAVHARGRLCRKIIYTMSYIIYFINIYGHIKVYICKKYIPT